MDEFNFQNNGFDNNYNYGYTPKKPKVKKKYSAFVVITSCILAAIIGALTASYSLLYFNQNFKDNTSQPIFKGDNISINVDEQATSVVEAVAKKVTPSVIGIRTTTSVASFFGNQQSSGEGSGVIYREDGYIITNYHVVSDAITNKASSKIQVFLDSDSANSYAATVVGYNISADIAVIKINASGLAAIEIADSSKLNVGQYVITVGNPGGLEFMDSVTYGVISGLDRVVSTDSNVSLIQTDAAINPGNSGGALVNVEGKLVGINSSKIASVEFEGMGFALPSNKAVEICENIIKKENSPEPYIGITLSEKYTPEILTLYGYPTGAVVLSVAEGSPAYQSGIRKGDIITKFNSKVVKEYTVLETYLSETKPNDKVSIEIYRNGRTYSTTITIGANNLVE